MKELITIVFVLFFINASSQTIHYTHRTSRLNIDDGVIVVPETGGMNHLWLISPGQPIRLQVYDSKLNWKHETTVPFKIHERNEITILPFRDKYYLYNQSTAGGRAFFWRIDPDGKVTDESKRLKAIIKSSFVDSTVSYQLFSQQDKLFLFANLYYPDIKKVVSTFVKINTLLEQEEVKRFAYSFDHSFETLQKMVIVPEKALIVLKKHVADDGEYFVDVLKINLTNSKIVGANFHSLTPFNYPEVLYNSIDSSVTVFAQMSRSLYVDKLIRNIFFATFDHLLDEKVSPATVRLSIPYDMYGAFTCINLGNGNSKWLPVHGIWNTLYDFQISRRLLIGLSSMVTLEGGSTTIVNGSSFQPKLDAIDPHLQFISPPGGIRLSVLNNRFRNVEDTIIKYRRRNYIEVAQYTSFTKENKNYLVVKELFPSKGKGLAMFHLNDKGRIAQLPLQLYERFHYALPQLQTTRNGKVMMPYVYRGEVGLVDISIEGDE